MATIPFEKYHICPPETLLFLVFRTFALWCPSASRRVSPWLNSGMMFSISGDPGISGSREEM